MQKVRLKFSRDERVRWISHLDVIRMLERTIRRTDLPVAYSKGFNPRIALSFGLPLSVGMTSCTEYFDLTLERWINPEVVMTQLQGTIPEGFAILDAKAINSGAPSLGGLIEYAEYEVEVTGPIENLENKIKETLDKKEIIVKKVTPKQEKIIDIRPKIKEVSLIQNDDNKATIKMILYVGQKGAARPDQVIGAIDNNLKVSSNFRTQLFAMISGQISPL